MLDRSTADTRGRSCEKPRVRVVDTFKDPVVTTVDRPSPAPWARNPSSDVSARHEVTSTCVLPSLAAGVASSRPIIEPTTVSDVEPVVGPLDLCPLAKSTMPLCVSARVSDSNDVDTSTTLRTRYPFTSHPADTLPLTAVCAVQSVDVAPVRHTRINGEPDPRVPSPSPSIVRLTDPEVGLLPRIKLLVNRRSNVNTFVVVARNDATTVLPTLRDISPPDRTLLVTEVIAVHTVAAIAEAPSRIRGERSELPPSDDPSKVTDVDPVVPPFELLKELRN